MLLFRSLTIGLLGACVLLLVQARPARTIVVHTPHAEPAVQVASTATIVDLAPGLSVGVVPSLIRLAPDERVVAVDDRAVANDLEAGAAITAKAPPAGGFVDLEVAGASGEHRRVLVLMH